MKRTEVIVLNKEFRAGILHAAQMLRDEAAGVALSDGARRYCLTDMAEKLETEAARREIAARRPSSDAPQVEMF